MRINTKPRKEEAGRSNSCNTASLLISLRAERRFVIAAFSADEAVEPQTPQGEHSPSLTHSHHFHTERLRHRQGAERRHESRTTSHQPARRQRGSRSFRGGAAPKRFPRCHRLRGAWSSPPNCSRPETHTGSAGGSPSCPGPLPPHPS